MRWLVLLTVSSAVLALVLLAGARGPSTSAASPLVIEVTSTSAGGGSCPDAANCTLRRAIEVANADTSANPVLIRFNSTAFPPAAGSEIAVSTAALPVLTRANTTIDGTGAGVRIISASPILSVTLNGIVLAGDGDAVRGIAVSGFTGACIAVQAPNVGVGGDSASSQGNRLANCATGIRVAGASATISGNRIGFAANDDAAAVQIGIQVSAGGAVIGSDSGGTLGNTIGNAATAIRVGGTGTAAFSGTRISGNILGRDPQKHPAPVTTAIDLRQPSASTTVAANDIGNAVTGIAVAADAGGVSVSGNRFEQNLFHDISGMAIDLDANGIVNPPHTADGHGANRGRNSPTITRATQSRISGTSDCASCTVQLYLAEHRAAAVGDYGSTPLVGGILTTDSSGAFALDHAPVTAGQWLTALVTDADGNTSEFAPGTRVGSGQAQCSNAALAAGWNQAGFYGSDTVVLGSSFPADGGGVRAIYRLDSATGQYAHWIAGGGPNTLSTLQPGDAYWFLADSAVTLPGGFSLSAPVPVSLKAGWNEVAYLGGTGDVSDALGSIAGKYRWVYHWANDAGAARWQAHGNGSEPAWADALSELRACQVYSIQVTSDVTLTPLQP